MSWLLEHPLPILLLGTTTVIVLAAVWLQSGHKALMYAMLAAILLTVTGMLVERAVETDREQVHAALYDIARAVERNDVRAVVGHLHPTLAGVRDEAEAEMARWKFDLVDIKQNLRITTYADEQPPRATAEFNVMVIVTNPSGTVQRERALRFVRVDFLREGDDWLVSDYEHQRPELGRKRRSP